MNIEISEISLNPSKIARLLGFMAFFLVLASLGGQLSRFMLGYDYLKGLVPLFNVNNERNIPTFFSVLLMIFAALLLAVIFILNRKRKVPDVSKWLILSLGFLFMAYDEAFQIHEMLNIPFRNLLNNPNLGIFYFAWVIPGIILVLVLVLFFLKFLLRLPAKTRFAFLLAGTLYLSGSIGLEFLGGRHAELLGTNNLTYNIMTTTEESFEMAGLIFFIYALLDYLADSYMEVRFRFDQ
ncbi:MAG: hypothetical protein IPK63_03150 [Candidatus Competibacteraceae bacterium]|nr:hypothetical protein [Candidatus Competibacteraceae bacterium]